MAKVFALLAAINEYESKPLRGCIADVDSVELHLRERAAKEHQIEIRVLKNAQATRQAIIDGFQTHLTNAGPQDTAVFYFAGHGSQQPCPPELWDREPDHLNETIVCFDGHLPGGAHLADKEIAVLIAQVAERNPHILVILDSCHSSSGTRGTDGLAVRSLPARSDPLPADLYLARGRMIGRWVRSGWSNPPDGRHVLMSACRADQQAWECVEGGQARGVFSLALIEALETSSSGITNNVLFQGVRAAVQRRIPYQHPQIEASVSEDLELPFLCGKLSGQPTRYFVSHGREGWVLNAGQVHGIPVPQTGDATRFALFPAGASQENIVARALVTRVNPASSIVELIPPQKDEPTAGFEAVVEHLPVRPTFVSLEGDTAGVTLIRKQLKRMDRGTGTVEIDSSGQSSVRLICSPDHYALRESKSGYLLCEPVSRAVACPEMTVLSNLEHFVRWNQCLDLKNPSSSISGEEFEIAVLLNGKEASERPIYLKYGPGCESISPQGFQIRMRNLGHRDLYFGLLSLSESFAIKPLATEGSVRIRPRQEAYAMNGGLLHATVPQEIFHQNRHVVSDYLMAIICTTEFDARLARQGKLGMPPDEGRSVARFAPTSLNNLLSWVHTRVVAKEFTQADDWATHTILITTARKGLWVPIGPRDAADLGLGVIVQPHNGLRAHARLGIGFSDPAPNIVPGMVGIASRRHIAFQQPWRSDPGLQVLELEITSGRQQVTHENPLQILTRIPHVPSESIVPVGCSSNPVGASTAAEGFETILVEQLPSSEDDCDLPSKINIFLETSGSNSANL